MDCLHRCILLKGCLFNTLRPFVFLLQSRVLTKDATSTLLGLDDESLQRKVSAALRRCWGFARHRDALIPDRARAQPARRDDAQTTTKTGTRPTFCLSIYKTQRRFSSWLEQIRPQRAWSDLTERRCVRAHSMTGTRLAYYLIQDPRRVHAAGPPTGGSLFIQTGLPPAGKGATRVGERIWALHGKSCRLRPSVGRECEFDLNYAMLMARRVACAPRTSWLKQGAWTGRRRETAGLHQSLHPDATSTCKLSAHFCSICNLIFAAWSHEDTWC